MKSTDPCYHQIQPAIHQHQTRQAHAILLLPTEGAEALFNSLPLLPKNHQPITAWPNPDTAFQEIATEIREVAMAIRKGKA